MPEKPNDGWHKTTWILTPSMRVAKHFLQESPELMIRERNHNIFIAVRPEDLRGRRVQLHDDLVNLGASDELLNEFELISLPWTNRPNPSRFETPEDLLAYVKERLLETDD